MMHVECIGHCMPPCASVAHCCMPVSPQGKSFAMWSPIPHPAYVAHTCPSPHQLPMRTSSPHSSPDRQVQQVVSEANTVVRELEALLARYLKQHPQLAPYAKKPAITYIVWSALAAPVVTVLLPLLAWLGGTGPRNSVCTCSSLQPVASSGPRCSAQLRS